MRQADGELVEHARKGHRFVPESMEEEADGGGRREGLPVFVNARRDHNVARVACDRHLRLCKRELPPLPVRSTPRSPRTPNHHHHVLRITSHELIRRHSCTPSRGVRAGMPPSCMSKEATTHHFLRLRMAGDPVCYLRA
jgi:hypothetical protein